MLRFQQADSQQPEKAMDALQKAGAREGTDSPVLLSHVAVDEQETLFLCTSQAALAVKSSTEGRPLNWPLEIEGVLPTKPGLWALFGRLHANGSTRLVISGFEPMIKSA